MEHTVFGALVARLEDRLSCRSVRTELIVVGMRNTNDRERIVDLLEAIDGVTEANVNFYNGRTRVIHNGTCTPKMVLDALTHAGYNATLLLRSNP